MNFSFWWGIDDAPLVLLTRCLFVPDKVEFSGAFFFEEFSATVAMAQ